MYNIIYKIINYKYLRLLTHLLTLNILNVLDGSFIKYILLKRFIRI